MGKINELGFELANMIAAGEVVNRPASAIKELCENSIDAGASRITVEIQNGGILLMRVSDDGCGMEPDDLPICIKRHATSKIKCAKDIDAIRTMGFRGEALAALSSVTEMRIISKTEDAEYGHMLTAEYGRVKDICERAAMKGTTVIAENLFKNMPARRKFLKRDATEASAVIDCVEKLALSHPEIAFRVISDGSVKLETSGNGKLDDVIYRVYGKENSKNLIRVDGSYAGIKISGYIGSPMTHKVNRSYQTFFVNKRSISSPIISSALSNAFTAYIPSDRFPVAVLFLEMNPRLVDVNVHPSKLEVKYVNEPDVYAGVYFVCSDTLASIEGMPTLTGGKDGGADRTVGVPKASVSQAAAPLKVNRGEDGREVSSSLKKNQLSFDDGELMSGGGEGGKKADFIEFEPGVEIPKPNKSLFSKFIEDVDQSPEFSAMETSVRKDPDTIEYYKFDSFSGTYKGYTLSEEDMELIAASTVEEINALLAKREREQDEREKKKASANKGGTEDSLSSGMRGDPAVSVGTGTAGVGSGADVGSGDKVSENVGDRIKDQNTGHAGSADSSAARVDGKGNPLPAPPKEVLEQKRVPKELFKNFDIRPGNVPTFEERDGEYGEGIYATFESGRNCYHRILGEIFNKYIVAEVVNRQNQKVMLVIDKHAAHERMIFESMRERLERAERTSQLLMVPVIADVGASCVSRIKKHIDGIENVGFGLEIEEKQVKIWALPAGVDCDDAEEMLLQVLSSIETGVRGGRSLPEIFDKSLFTIACKAAVKGGRECDAFTVDAIVKAVVTDAKIRFCPHGRPVAYEMSLSQLDSIFKR